MKKYFRFSWRRLCRDQEGAAAVEFSLLALTFILIIGIVMDFGHYLYLRQVLTNASREGARYGSIFKDPKITSGDIVSYVKNKYGADLTVNADSTAVPTATGTIPAWNSGANLIVSVQQVKQWFFLDGLIKCLDSYNSLCKPTGKTTMRLE